MGTAPSEEQQQLSAPSQEKATPISNKPQAIEIGSNAVLDTGDLQNKPFGTWAVLWIIPIGIGLLFLQMKLHQYIVRKRSEVHPKKSSEYFAEAKKAKAGSPEFYQLINKAFLVRLSGAGRYSYRRHSPGRPARRGISWRGCRIFARERSRAFYRKNHYP